MRGLRSSAKWTSARSTPSRNRSSRPIFSTTAARRAGETSVWRLLTETSTWLLPGASPQCTAGRRPPDRAGRPPAGGSTTGRRGQQVDLGRTGGDQGAPGRLQGGAGGDDVVHQQD